MKAANFVRCGDVAVDSDSKCIITWSWSIKLILLLLITDPKTFAFVKLYEGLSKEDQRVVIKELKELLKAVKASYVPQEFAVVCQSLDSAFSHLHVYISYSIHLIGLTCCFSDE